ncbi:MAG: nucleotidyltransferase family protein [Acidobacteria bacterium]|nr:nucleotidyltransferase family protein [Acidobacteriota bacterium]
MPTPSVPAVIIAAGSSSRLGQPKQLLVFKGETLLQRAIRIAHEAGAAPIFVVLGAHHSQIESGLDPSAIVVTNPEWQQGMATSIRAGIHALDIKEPQPAGVLLLLCDQPAVTPDHLRRMLTAFQRDPVTAVASVYAGRRGIPALFPRNAFPDLLGLRGDHGARGLLADPERAVIEVPLENGELDIDRPEDLAHLRAR